MSSICLSVANRVRFIVFLDLVIALVYTIYRVTTLSFTLQRVFGVENGQQVYKIYENLSMEQVKLMKFSTVFLITATVVGLALEVFLFFLGNNGVRSKCYRHCKHWFIVRIILLIVSILGSVIEYVRNEYTEIFKGMSDNHYNEYCTSSVADGYPNIHSVNHVRSHSQSHVTF